MRTSENADEGPGNVIGKEGFHVISLCLSHPESRSSSVAFSASSAYELVAAKVRLSARHTIVGPSRKTHRKWFKASHPHAVAWWRVMRRTHSPYSLTEATPPPVTNTLVVRRSMVWTHLFTWHLDQPNTAPISSVSVQSHQFLPLHLGADGHARRRGGL